ncbi:MAG: hypothetical protein OXC06_18225 [Acidimicrobiaceae bacterium]|nr:hypothetical protein [Acidimicrobiaceae bacterium]
MRVPNAVTEQPAGTVAKDSQTPVPVRLGAWPVGHVALMVMVRVWVRPGWANRKVMV